MKTKGFFAIIVALILVSTCILGSITPRDEDEGIGFGIISVIFTAIIIAAAFVASKEKPRLNESARAKSQRKDSMPLIPEAYIQTAVPHDKTGHSKAPTL